MPKRQILGIAGSLRHGSFNRAALRAAQSLVPEDMELTIFDRLGDIPLFNQDQEKTPPDSVIQLKQAVRSADAILFATPEYNYSIPGVLKNAIDWASRPYGDSAWEGKPVAIMSASIGAVGGARAQYQLRQTFVFLNMFALNQPEVLITYAPEKFDDQGKLIDDYTANQIKALLQALDDWITRLSGQKVPEKTAEEHEYQNAYKNPMDKV